MVEKLKHAPTKVKTAAELILGTGQRPNAAIKMRRDQFDGEWMIVTDEKQSKQFETFCPDHLRTYLSTLPRHGTFVLAKNLTEPLGYDAIEKAFRNWRATLGDKARPYVLHGLRKLAIVRLAEAGCSDAEIQAVTGQSAEMVAYYRSKASRRTLSRSAQKRREK
ncbi:tyrosine-type recombinase/integrase [Pelagimonas varians]|uniref:Phage integrase family protein n=1 Tax=Pelagimonas varians TaxID=696760 RepID=A0A238KYB8_9RHOB|nr:tyrosine-type recombinase/integrase [Pelagimonas varians]PYG27625.1 phage integrase family protein [Pelagimonas varians]SMX47813.1 Phage integrase family protein [Pelagimonas varians]